MTEALKVLYNEELKESIYRHFTHQEYDYLAEKCGGWGSKMMGYPAFTQEYPRGTKYTLEEFDTLLLQIDSDCKSICWGMLFFHEKITFFIIGGAVSFIEGIVGMQLMDRK